MTERLSRQEILALPDLLQNLCDGARTGTLVLSGDRTLFLYFREGSLAAAYDQNPELLADCLARTGTLDRESLDAFREFFRSTPASLARQLVEQDKVTPEALQGASTFAIRELLCEALTWDSPAAEFHDGPPLPELVRVNLPLEGVSVPTKPLLMEAVYQLDEWSRIREHVPADDDVPTRIGDAEPAGDEQATVHSLVDGRRRVRDIVRESPQGRCDTCAALAELVRAGAIRMLDRDELVALAEEGKTQALASSNARDRLVGIYERAEALGLENASVSLWLAQALEERGDLERASKRYLTAGRELAKRQERGATRAFRRAMELRPEDGALQRELILKLLSQDRLEDAALQAEAYVGWLREQGDAARAIRSLKGILERLEEFEEILWLSAELHSDAGNKTEALAYYRRVAEARLEGELAHEFSDIEKALVLERILAFDPEDRTARFRLGMHLVEPDPARAATHLEAFVESAQQDAGSNDPRVISAVEALGRLRPERSVLGPKVQAYLDCGEVAQASQLLEEAHREGELTSELLGSYERLHAMAKSRDSHRLLARALLSVGYMARGLSELHALAQDLFDEGELEESLAVHKEVLGHDPYEWISRSALAQLEMELELFEDWRRSMRNLADLARIGGKTEIAIQTLTIYLLDASEDHAARLQLAQLLVEQGGEDVLDQLVDHVEAAPPLREAIRALAAPLKPPADWPST